MPTDAEIETLSARFPGQAARIARLIARDEGFQALCTDYAMARAALEIFSRRALSEPRPEVLDYRRLVGELEREIASALARPIRPCEVGLMGGAPVDPAPGSGCCGR